MTPWRNHDSQEPKARESPLDLPKTPTSDHIEADHALISGFLADELSPSDHDWVEYRLYTDSKFRTFAEPHLRKWGASRGLSSQLDLMKLIESVAAEQNFNAVQRLRMLTELGIKPAPFTRRPPKPLHPEDFGQLLATAKDSEEAKQLMNDVIDIVAYTGQPDLWIVEAARARQRGALRPEVAEYFILELARSATRRLVRTDSILLALDARIRRIQDEDGDEELAEWETLNAKFEARWNDLVTQILLRNGEPEIAQAFAVWERHGRENAT